MGNEGFKGQGHVLGDNTEKSSRIIAPSTSSSKVPKIVIPKLLKKATPAKALTDDELNLQRALGTSLSTPLIFIFHRDAALCPPPLKVFLIAFPPSSR